MIDELTNILSKHILHIIQKEKERGRDVSNLENIGKHLYFDKISKEQLLKAIDKLVEEKKVYFDVDTGSLILDNEYYKKQVKNKIYERFLSKAVSVIVAMATATGGMFFAYTIFNNGFVSNSEISDQKSVDSLVDKTVTNKIWEYRKNIDLDSLSKFNRHALQNDVKLININERIKGVESNLNNINSLLEKSPEKFVEIASINKELEELDKRLTYFVDTNRAELDRMSNFNIGLIGLVAALLAINVWGGFRKNKE